MACLHRMDTRQTFACPAKTLGTSCEPAFVSFFSCKLHIRQRHQLECLSNVSEALTPMVVAALIKSSTNLQSNLVLFFSPLSNVQSLLTSRTLARVFLF